jgi:hypothetical protein
MIVAHLRDFLARGGRARILVGDYLDVTEPAALRRLNDLSGDLDVRVYEARDRGFHLKTYIFQTDIEGIAFVGSSNLSAPALTSSIEWNYKVISRHERAGFSESPLASKISSTAIKLSEPTRYAAMKPPIANGGEWAGVRRAARADNGSHSIQQEALGLCMTRREGFPPGSLFATGSERPGFPPSTWWSTIPTFSCGSPRRDTKSGHRKFPARSANASIGRRSTRTPSDPPRCKH